MPADRPNILIVYTDQQRYDTLGINGNDRIKTPRLDAWGRKAVHFTRGYVNSPVCLPSRVSMMTGRYARAHRSFTNNFYMLARERDLASHLRAHGYRTALVGKDHCFAHRKRDVFDHVLEAGHLKFPEPRDEVEVQINTSREGTVKLPFADDPVPGDEGMTARLCRAADRWIGQADTEQPWFMWLSIPDPHPPFMVGAPYNTMYDETPIDPPAWTEDEMRNKPDRQRFVVEWDRYGKEYAGDRIDKLRRIYWGMVSCIDTHVGKLLDALESRGLDDNTIVIFTSDHGDYMGDHRMIRKGPHVYEALTHVPLMIRWGDRFKPRSTDAFMSNVDLFPTLCDLAGLPTPEQVQGVSLADFLQNEGDPPRDAAFFEHGKPGQPLRQDTITETEYATLRDQDMHHLCPPVYTGRTRGIRTDRWKYIHNVGDVDELYDLDNDPNELANLADEPQYNDVLHEHRRRLLEWALETEDPMQADSAAV